MAAHATVYAYERTTRTNYIVPLGDWDGCVVYDENGKRCYAGAYYDVAEHRVFFAAAMNVLLNAAGACFREVGTIPLADLVELVESARREGRVSKVGGLPHDTYIQSASAIDAYCIAAIGA